MKHSTEEIELIREYFNLSNSQVKNPDKINISKDVIASDEIILAIEKTVIVNTETLESTQLRIVSLEKLKTSNNSKILSLNKKINLIDRELELDKVNRLRGRQQQRYNPSTESRSRHPKLPLKTKLVTLSSIIKKDITYFLSLAKGQFIRLKKDFIVAVTMYLAIPLIALIIYKVFLNLGMENFLVNLYLTSIGIICFILICFICRYVQEKLEIIDEINSRLWRFNQSTSQEVRSAVNPGRIFTNILEGRDSINKMLMLRYSELLRSTSELKITQENIEYELISLNKRVNLLIQSIQESPSNKEQRIQEIKIQESRRQENRLQYLRSVVYKLLDKDTDQLIKSNMEKLKIESIDKLSKKQNIMQTTEPIIVMKGVSTISDASTEGTIIETDSEMNLSRDNKNILIQKDDFQSDSDNKIYGVYEFLALFLCANFITYYRCYFNFITGNSVNEESCDYMYDSIVSIKIQERSSNRLKNESEKRIYGKRLVLTTSDGKAFRILIAVDPKKNLGISVRLSDVNQVAQEVRDILRENRRIDAIYTRSLD